MIATLFKPDPERYEGLRPINIYLLRVLYFLMAAFVATEASATILKHQGPWDPVAAVAWCVWVAYPTLSILGLIHPLRMLPIVLFTIFYKTLWVVVVALPLWRAGTLAGSSAEEIARVFVWAPVVCLIVPWRYVFRHFVLPAKRASAERNDPLALSHEMRPADRTA